MSKVGGMKNRELKVARFSNQALRACLPAVRSMKNHVTCWTMLDMLKHAKYLEMILQKTMLYSTKVSDACRV